MMRKLVIRGRSGVELELSKGRIRSYKTPAVTFENDTRELSVKNVKSAEVIEMGAKLDFIFNWMGIETALILIFFGLTSASQPLYNIFTALIGYPTPDLPIHVGRVILSLIMVWTGITLIPWFDGVELIITSNDGKMLRYMRNVRFIGSLKKFRSTVLGLAR